jgi:hypothetical protein
MDDTLKNLTRREALRVGAGAAGALAMLLTGPFPALAQQSTRSTLTMTGDDSEWRKVAAVFNTDGMIEPGDVLLIDLPRSDIHATLFGISIKPELGIDTEITFQHISNGAIVKWEFALLDNEVNPVLNAIFAQGLQPPSTNVNAIHNHFVDIVPEVKFMHGTSIGNPIRIAKALRRALSHSGTPIGGSSEMGSTGLPNGEIEQILGGMGTVSDGVLSVTVEREETFSKLGIALESAMQVESMFTFQSIGNGRAATVAEIVVLPDEVDAVTRSLSAHGFRITAIHNHELFIAPKVYYLHAFGAGDAFALARAERQALNHTNSK